MLIIGCDFHSGFQQVAIFDNRTGEIQEKRLGHREEWTYAQLCQAVMQVSPSHSVVKKDTPTA